jgi:hypothetical protein
MRYLLFEEFSVCCHHSQKLVIVIPTETARLSRAPGSWVPGRAVEESLFDFLC